ncbi:MAG: cold shock domain-containing protein [Gemmatimonadota bacterium]
MARRGKVKWYNEKMGYGFIAQASGEDVFVHFTVLRGDGTELTAGMEVEFEVRKGDRGPIAEWVSQAPG